MHDRRLMIAVLPTLAMLLGALAPTQALSQTSCSITCIAGSCSANGPNCSCRCNLLFGTPICKSSGGSGQQLSQSQTLDLVTAQSEAFMLAIDVTLADKPQVGQIHLAIDKAQKANDTGDFQSYRVAIDELDAAIYSLSAEDQQSVHAIIGQLVGK